MGLGRGTNFSYLLEPASSQPTSWLVRILEHGQATGNSGLTRFTKAQTQGKPPPSPI